MLLVVDVGNTHTVLGLYDGEHPNRDVTGSLGSALVRIETDHEYALPGQMATRIEAALEML